MIADERLGLLSRYRLTAALPRPTALMPSPILPRLRPHAHNASGTKKRGCSVMGLQRVNTIRSERGSRNVGCDGIIPLPELGRRTSREICASARAIGPGYFRRFSACRRACACGIGMLKIIYRSQSKNHQRKRNVHVDVWLKATPAEKLANRMLGLLRFAKNRCGD